MKSHPLFSLDLRALAVWRIALGSVVLLDILLRLRDLQAFYGDQGVFSRTHYFEQAVRYDGYHLFLASGTSGGLLALFSLWAAAALCLIIGYQTRLAALVTWYFVASIQLRTPAVMDGGDDILRLLLFWAPFLPLSARWSWDAKKNPKWAELPNTYRSVATFAVTLQFFVLYLFAALLKTGDDWLKTGDALYYTLSIDQFATQIAVYLSQFPELLRPLTWAALGYEYLLALLVLLAAKWAWARTAFFILAAGFHLGIASLLHLGIFVPIVIAGLTAFLPTKLLDRFAPHRPSEEVSEPLPPAYRLSWPVKLFAGFICAMVAVFNLYSIEHGHRIPPWSSPVVSWTFQQQHWHFFAPFPFREDGWFVLEITHTDGTVEDGWSRGPLVNGKPTSVATRFPNHRWRRWLQNLLQVERRDIDKWRERTLEFAAKQWQKEHPNAEVQKFRLLFVSEPTPPPGEKAEQNVVQLAERTVKKDAVHPHRH